MTPELKTTWLAALRSGKYAKGNGMLRLPPDEDDPDGPTKYCCLGVLLCISEHEDDIGWLQRSEGMEELTDGLLAEYGMTIDQHAELIQMNDDSATWEPVIELIEELL